MTALEALIEEVNAEFSFLEETKNQVHELLQIVGGRSPGNIEIAAANQYLSQFYNGIENVLKRIIKFVNLPLIRNDNWHIELLNYFYNNPSSPKIHLFDRNNYEVLNTYRKIRHVVRQGYNFQMDWDKLSIAMENIPKYLTEFKIKILNFVDSIEK